ncbi:MAG TPA: tetratricopeptide repeat protein [Candidatus Acidoferrales bacterium]|nr:tetratricopeptide repeat protein [Candidatus Acidoferrales bacterium]
MFDKIKFLSATAFLLFLISDFVFASEADDLMKQGNQFYQNKQYEQAVEAYQNVINMGYVGTSLYYNLGNSYYREGKIGYAILFYEKALEISPGDDDVLHNLAIANTKTVDKIDTLPKFFLFQWWESILALFPESGWTFAVYLFYLLLLVSIGLYFFARGLNLQKYSVYSGLISALFLIITAALWIVSANRALTVKNAVVLEPTTVVKLAPDSTSNDAFVIHEGLKVRELDRVESWVKIRLQDGKEGWIQQNEIGMI